jgi:hypothetical protein
MGARKFLQFLLTGILGIVGLLGLFASLVRLGHGGDVGGGLVVSAVMLIMAAFTFGMFEVQIRTLRKKGDQVRKNVEAIAAQVFDSQALVRPGYDMSVTSGAMGGMMTQMETDVGFTADGSCGGVRVSVASHASTLGRQIGELSHVYSYVVVDMKGLETRFRLSKEGAGSVLTRAVGMTSDAKVGDAAFDGTWSVDCDEAMAREVLDEAVRAALMDLQSKVKLVSQDFGVGTMSVIVTNHGLALRWPGDIDPPLATFIARLLLDMRGKILAFHDRKAARGGAEQTYRVVADPAPLPIEEPVSEQVERKLQS